MRGTIRRLGRLVQRTLEAVGAIFLWSIVALIGLQVVSRYVFNNSVTWTDEAARLALVWMTLIGGAAASFRDAHLKIELFHPSLAPPRRRLVHAIVGIATVATLVVLITANAEVIDIVSGIEMATLPLSSKYFSYAVSSGACFMIAGTLYEYWYPVNESR